jgi:CheY-like chemotaxis protein
MSRPLQILIVEDNVNDANLLVRELRRSGFQFEWQRVDTETEYLAKLNSGLDLILSDYEMPQFNGLRALQLLKEHSALEIPFIIVSGTIGEEKAVVAVQQGAADYLLKDRITRLPAAVAAPSSKSRSLANAGGSRPNSSKCKRWKWSASLREASRMISIMP